MLAHVIAQDVGKALNPALVEGQMHGGTAQGIGWALLEELAHDEDGQLRGGSFAEYALPSDRPGPADRDADRRGARRPTARSAPRASASRRCAASRPRSPTRSPRPPARACDELPMSPDARLGRR